MGHVILNVFVLACSAHPMYDGTCICQVSSDEKAHGMTSVYSLEIATSITLTLLARDLAFHE